MAAAAVVLFLKCVVFQAHDNAVVSIVETTKDRVGALRDNAPHNLYAYVFFATSNIHARAVGTIAKRIQSLSTRSDLDYVVFVKGLDAPHTAMLRRQGMIIREVTNLPKTSSAYYKDVAIKYEPFRMFEYNRVIQLDADIWVAKSIDHLFELPDVPLASPIANWENEMCLMTAVMIIQPNRRLWTQINANIPKYLNGKTEMDLINELFEHRIPGTGRILPEVLILPSKYATLSTEFTHPEPYNTDPMKLWEEVLIFHFSGGYGKPWAPHSLGSSNTDTERLYALWKNDYTTP